VKVVQNSACGKQLTAGRSSRLPSLPFGQRPIKFLIANLELEFRASARKQTVAPKSNRKYSAISYSGARRVYPAPISCSADGSGDAYVLIGTLGISENELSRTKERRKQNPNRDKIAFYVNSAAHVFSRQRSAAAHRRQIISPARHYPQSPTSL
jgi:hypothetical protein